VVRVEVGISTLISPKGGEIGMGHPAVEISPRCESQNPTLSQRRDKDGAPAVVQGGVSFSGTGNDSKIKGREGCDFESHRITLTTYSGFNR